MMQQVKRAVQQQLMQQKQLASLPQLSAESVQDSLQPSDDMEWSKQSTAELHTNIKAQSQAVLPVPTTKLQLPKHARLEQLGAASAQFPSKRCKLQQDMPASQPAQHLHPDHNALKHDKIIVNILMGIVLASQQQTLQTGIVSASAGSAQGAALFEPATLCSSLCHQLQPHAFSQSALQHYHGSGTAEALQHILAATAVDRQQSICCALTLKLTPQGLYAHVCVCTGAGNNYPI